MRQQNNLGRGECCGDYKQDVLRKEDTIDCDWRVVMRSGEWTKWRITRSPSRQKHRIQATGMQRWRARATITGQIGRWVQGPSLALLGHTEPETTAIFFICCEQIGSPVGSEWLRPTTCMLLIGPTTSSEQLLPADCGRCIFRGILHSYLSGVLVYQTTLAWNES